MKMIPLMASLILFSMCDSAPTAPSNPTPADPPAVILPSGTRVIVEIAANEESRSAGLMFRDRLDKDRGMLFLFPSTGQYPFWMKNTLIPLDIIWIDEGRRIVHIKNEVPPCPGDPCTSYPPGVPARYVLEIAAGEAVRHRLEVGNVLTFVNIERFTVR